jgi:hypothetical protein
VQPGGRARVQRDRGRDARDVLEHRVTEPVALPGMDPARDPARDVLVHGASLM